MRLLSRRDTILFCVLRCTAFNHMSCFHQMWYYSAWYPTLLLCRVLRCAAFNHSACHQIDVGLLRVTIRCVFLQPARLLYYALAMHIIRRFIKWFLSRLPTCRVIRDIICCVLYSAVFYNVFCVPTRVSRSRTSIHHASMLPDVLSVSTGSILCPSVWSPTVCHQSSDVTSVELSHYVSAMC
jgi:hypothetical protein